VQYAAIASLRKVSSKVELSAKSVLVHSCVGRLGVAGRERNYTVKVLTAAAPALSAALTHITDSGAMKKALEAQGLTVSLHSVQGFLRSKHETNWARHVLELLFLPEFLEHARETGSGWKIFAGNETWRLQQRGRGHVFAPVCQLWVFPKARVAN
jgi:hypothetical protein